LVETISIEFCGTANQLIINAQDPNQTCHYNTVLKKKSFTTFTCPGDTVVSVRVAVLNKIFGCVEFGEWVDINLHKRGNWVLNFEFQKQKDETCLAWVQTEVFDDEAFVFPDLSKLPWLKMPSKDFAKHVERFARLNNDITLKSSSEGFWFVTGDDFGGGITGQRTIYKNGAIEDARNFRMEKASESSFTFSSDFLKNAVIFHNISDEVTIFPSDDIFSLSYEIHEENGDKEKTPNLSIGRLDVHIAPRVSS